MFDNKIDEPTRNHLTSVYGTVASLCLFASLGILVHCIEYITGGTWSVIGVLVLMSVLIYSRYNPDALNHNGRLACLNIFGFFFGLSDGPLLEDVFDADPQIIVPAFLFTGIIFTCFSISAMIAPEEKYLWIGAPLMSVFMVMFTATVLNTWFQSETLSIILLILGPLVSSCFILYDTQRIIHSFRKGDKDSIWHAFMFFLDLAALFKDIVMLLLEKRKRAD